MKSKLIKIGFCSDVLNKYVQTVFLISAHSSSLSCIHSKLNCTVIKFRTTKKQPCLQIGAHTLLRLIPAKHKKNATLSKKKKNCRNDFPLTDYFGMYVVVEKRINSVFL